MDNQHTTFKIHPSIGIARLGNTDKDFYLAPEQPGELPIACNEFGEELKTKGNPKRVTNFKDKKDKSKLKKQAARFKIFAYDNEDDTEGREIVKGGTYKFLFETSATAPTLVDGKVIDIDWTVHLVNKKASWYDFQETNGIAGYAPNHPLRNPEVNQPDLRRQLIIDPGPITVNSINKEGHFARYGSEIKKKDNSKYSKLSYPQTFPPEDIKPNSIDTLGRVLTTIESTDKKEEKNLRLIVLGGDGNSGSTKTPVITNFVNNDGWFDDISDGPVTATVHYSFEQVTYDGEKPVTNTVKSSVDVQVPAWAVVGYPRYVPQMEDMITMDEKMYDVFVRHFAYDPQVYGVAPYDKASNSPKTEEEFEVWRNNARYNPEYYSKFFKEVWPILRRPDDYQYTYDFDNFSGGDPHNKGTGGNLSKDALSKTPVNGVDPTIHLRKFVYGIMRQPYELNNYEVNKDHNKTSAMPRLMPMLSGNNPLTNVSPQKFLAMTNTQLFFLKQWADGKFVNECSEWGENNSSCENPWAKPPTTGVGIDRGVLSNLLGGAFCPGGELSWIIENPAIYSEPYRIKHASYIPGQLTIPKPIADKDGSPAPNLKKGLEPGDLTKYIGIPWQADFHECTSQPIDITYDHWSNTYPESTGDPIQESIAVDTPWWPAHRPVVVSETTISNGEKTAGAQVYWASGIPANNAGDLQMVQAWKDLGFLAKNSDGSYSQVERNDDVLGKPVTPGNRILGKSVGRRSDDNHENS